MPQTSLPEYVYLPLRNKEQSMRKEDFVSFDSFNIRIIELEFEENLDALLQCEIKHIDVSNDYKFSALSYVWGAPVFSHTMRCGNAQLAITASLDKALRRLRKAKKLRLWVDALCINQKDIKEKSQQVQRMGQIYRYARSTLVWLGGDGEHLDDMDKCINFFWGLSSSSHEDSVTADRADKSIREELLRFFGHTKLDAVHKFLALPWFTRRWIIQEGLLGSTHFYCGSLDITKHALDHAVFILKKSSFQFDQAVLDHIQSLEWEAEAFEHPDSYPGSGILDLLVSFSHMSCSVDHDRIYAYLGLANDVRSPFVNMSPEAREEQLTFGKLIASEELPPRPVKLTAIQVDYDEDVAHVYADFAERMLEDKDHLELLHCAGAFRPHSSSTSRLHQSWAPNWRLPMRHKPFISVPWFRAGLCEKESKPFFNYPWCSVDGFVFDEAVVCIPVHGVDATSAEARRHMFFIGEMCTALGMPKRYVTGERRWQALALTFIADHGANDKLKRYYSSGKNSFTNGKLMKRNASERDMHTLLDWWARYDEGLIPIPPYEPPSEVSNESGDPTDSPLIQNSDLDHERPDEESGGEDVGGEEGVVEERGIEDMAPNVDDEAKANTKVEEPEVEGSGSAFEEADTPRDPQTESEGLDNNDDQVGSGNSGVDLATAPRSSVDADEFASMSLESLDSASPDEVKSAIAMAKAAGFGPQPPFVALLLKRHAKSMHRHTSIGSFLKPSATAGEWGPTSYEKQSGWHSRIDEEMEPYQIADMNRMSRKTALENGEDVSGIPNEDDDCPEDKPYDVEWRHQGGGLVWFDGHYRNEERYAELANKTLRGRCFFLTKKGYLGIGPDDMAKGDTVAILYGGRTPFVLRQVRDPPSWSLLGDCYVHGIMDGEAMKMDRGPDRKFVIR